MKESQDFVFKIIGVVIALCIAVTTFTALYHFVDTSYKTETAYHVTATDSVIFDGVYVRDETVITYNGGGVVNYKIPDGGKAAIGDTIADVYQTQGQIDTIEEIADLQSQLETMESITNPGTLEQAQPADLQRSITENYVNYVETCGEGNTTSAIEISKDLLNAISSYQVAISQGTVNFNSQIEELESQIAALQSSEASPLTTIEAEQACYFSSKVDGYESRLNTDKLDSITASQIQDIIDESETATSGSSTAIGKAISGYGWYMVGLFDNSDLKYSIGDKVTIRQTKTGSESTGKIVNLQTYDDTDQTKVTVYCDEMSGDFVQNRVDRVQMIRGEYEGIRIPREAIRFKTCDVTKYDADGKEYDTQEDCRGVYIEDGEVVEFRRINVIYEDIDYVISSLDDDTLTDAEKIDEDDFVSLYDSIIVEGIDANEN